MSKQSSAKRKVNEPAIGKHAVSQYWLEHPSFLIDNPDLLVQIQVQNQENGVVSLTQIQAGQSREKIKQLKAQLEEAGAEVELK